MLEEAGLLILLGDMIGAAAMLHEADMQDLLDLFETAADTRPRTQSRPPIL